MSNLKKVVSLLLCLSMLAGVFTVLGGTLAPAASAMKLDELPAEPTINKVKTVEQLNAQYGDAGYYYLGLEFYESDGNLTDGYVNAGDTLTVKVYLKTSFYVKRATTVYAFDRNFFDVSNGATTLTYDASVAANAKDDGTNNTGIFYPTEGGATSKSYYNKANTPSNTAFKLHDSDNKTPGVKFTWNTTWAGNDNYFYKDATTSAAASSPIGLDLAMVRSWDLCKMTNIQRSDNASKYLKYDSDEYIYSFDIKVRSDLEEGTTGSTILRTDMFQCYDRFKGDAQNSKRRGDATLALTETVTGTAPTMYTFESLTQSNFDIADCNNTFVIGTNPTPAGKFFARFVDNDNEILDTVYAAKGENVTLPAVKENFIGWANLATGNIEIDPGESLTMPESNVTYKAVYSTDKFEVTLDCDGGKIGENEKVTVALAYGETLDLSAYVPTKDYNDFVGWNPSTYTLKNIGSEGRTVKAIWSRTEYTITFKIMDYSTGEWFVYDTATGKYGDKAPQPADIIKGIDATTVNWSGAIDTLNKNSSVKNNDKDDETTSSVKEIEFDATKTLYIYTRIKYDITIRVPKYDAASDTYSDTDYTVYDFSGQKADYNTGWAKPFLETDVAKAVYNPEAGYDFKGWFDQDGREIKQNGTTGVSVYPENGKTVVITAKYDRTVFTLKFQYSDPTAQRFAVWSETFTVGDILNYAEKGTITFNGNEVTLPEIGVESSEQVTEGWMTAGYRFDGWQIQHGYDKTEMTSGFEFTKEFVKYAKSNNEIQVKGVWTALEYPIEFYYMTEESSPNYVEKPYYTLTATVGENLGKYNSYTDEQKADLDSKAPTGKEFFSWQLPQNEKGETDYYLHKGGAKIYARYERKGFLFYVDYNNGLENNIMKFGTIYYGDDPEYQNPDNDADRGYGVELRKSRPLSSYIPGDDYELVGWEVYYLDDAADINDPTKWHEGYNDRGDGSTEAYSAMVYKAQWVNYDELLYRVYDTDGELYSALSKSFKKYYWSADMPCDKADAALNAKPETEFVFFIKPSLENWDWNGFFTAEMWSNLHLRFDAIGLANDTFSPENIVQIIKLLISVIKGEQELPEM